MGKQRQADVTCEFCNKVFKKDNRFINRTNKKKGKHYCSQSCAGKDKVRINPSLKEHLRNGSSRDSYSQFRRHYLSAGQRARKKGMDFTITLRDLKAIWDKQEGKCVYTHLPMLDLPSTTNKRVKEPMRASLDRIDSSRGYTPDNVQWVTLICQFAKNCFPEKQVVDFINSLK